MGIVIALVLTAIVSLFLETTFFAVPLLLVSVIVLSVLVKDPLIFFLAFILGLVSDSLMLQTLGTTSLFLLSVLFLIRLYERKFETRNVPFVLMISIIAISSYLLIFGSYVFFLQFVIALSLSFILFIIFNRFVPVAR
jgi:rod shape-determining protein MreD